MKHALHHQAARIGRRTVRGARAAQCGAALLIALLTVTLVATFAATALWQQWRATEIEAAERARLQSAWVLIGALDWSRLILTEDARADGGAVDSLAEPWAVPLAEAKLTSFLAADKNVASDALEGLPEAFLSGQILDAQAKLNVRNLARPSGQLAFRKLFELLGLPVEEVTTLTAGLRRANPQAMAVGNAADGAVTAASGAIGALGGAVNAPDAAAAGGVTGLAAQAGTENAPLMPQRVAELVWLGLSPSTVAAIEPYVTILPADTRVNINTASAEVLYASIPKLDLAGAKRLVAQRQRKAFRSLAEASEALQQGDAQLVAADQGVSTNYFEVRGRLRLEGTWVEEQSLLMRGIGRAMTVVWRQRGAGTTEVAVPP